MVCNGIYNVALPSCAFFAQLAILCSTIMKKKKRGNYNYFLFFNSAALIIKENFYTVLTLPEVLAIGNLKVPSVDATCNTFFAKCSNHLMFEVQ